MHFVWQWDPIAFCALVVVLTVGISALRAIAWMNRHHILTWTDLFTWRRRIHRYNEALARGGVPCRCNWGRTYHERRTISPNGATGTLLYITTRPCVSCCGVGARLPEPKPVASTR